MNHLELCLTSCTVSISSSDCIYIAASFLLLASLRSRLSDLAYLLLAEPNQTQHARHPRYP
jgi:hypothetical protein